MMKLLIIVVLLVISYPA
ncbi:type I toxin-antitoxin system Ibs family toxin, partial [Escherichia coli]